ncbi:phosphatase PAP2 family protein [uncultured Bacteroides sp.]|uniref:phosphatase PAP2 family protein n=1 Tax=uncultured Bacteroides sp. TaxID=162156 RepID=UPI002AABB788|nr:phosphatase PAP2 family protein [uncultured Bacteroides sp.]
MKHILLFVITTFLILNCNAQNWDINTLKRINGIDNSFVTGCSKALSKSEPYLAVGVPMVLGSYALMKNNRGLLDDAIYIGTSVAEAVVLTSGMKYAVDRERPFDRYPDLIEKRAFVSSASFPSGHTATAFSLATSLSLRYSKWYVIAPSYIWACSVGFARMNEGVHYPSDIFAGAVIGSGCAVVNVYVNKWLNKLLIPKTDPNIVNY